MLSRTEIFEIFRETEVLKEGHFLLSSGRHSSQYLQCAQVFKYPDILARLCRDLADKLDNKKPDLCIAPAVGGILLSYEMARFLKVPAIFAEREAGKMVMRRGFNINLGERVLVVEDVITTGGSAKEVVEMVREWGGIVTEVAVIVDRSKGKASFDVPLKSLIAIDVASYTPEECPLCLKSKPLVKPGSREF